MRIVKPISQRASESGLPCSKVNNRANSSCLASSASANLTSSAPRSRIGLADQAGNAALAAAIASLSCARSARGASASTSSVAGLMTSSLATPGTSLPLISNLNSLIAFSSLRYVHPIDGGRLRTIDDVKFEMDRSDQGIADTLGSVGASLADTQTDLARPIGTLDARKVGACSLYRRRALYRGEPTPKYNRRFAIGGHFSGSQITPSTARLCRGKRPGPIGSSNEWIHYEK